MMKIVSVIRGKVSTFESCFILRRKDVCNEEF